MHVYQAMVFIDQQLYSFILPVHIFRLKSVSYVLFRSLKIFTFLASNEKVGLTLPWHCFDGNYSVR